MRQEIKKRLIFYLCLFIIIGVLVYLWWPSSVHWRNMRQARREIDSVIKELEGDIRFSQLTSGVGTATLGLYIYVRGGVPDQQSIEYLESLMERRISPKFRVKYFLRIPKDSNKAVQSSKEKTEEAKPILSEKEKHISKNISDYFQMGFTVEIKGPLTIEEVEKESLDRVLKSERKDIPKVPFGFNNDEWNEFKNNHKDGDEIYRFTSDEKSWRGLYGREGYALIRNEKVVLVIITMLS